MRTGFATAYKMQPAYLIEATDDSETIQTSVPYGDPLTLCEKCANRLGRFGWQSISSQTLPVGDRFYCDLCLRQQRSTHGPIIKQ